MKIKNSAIPVAVGGALSVSVMLGYFVKYLWNKLMPNLFGLKKISYWQAVMLIALAKLMFGNNYQVHVNSENKGKKHHHKKADDGEHFDHAELQKEIRAKVRRAVKSGNFNPDEIRKTVIEAVQRVHAAAGNGEKKPEIKVEAKVETDDEQKPKLKFADEVTAKPVATTEEIEVETTE